MTLTKRTHVNKVASSSKTTRAVPTWEAQQKRGGPKPLKGSVVVITGAASGLGRALCYQLAREECSLALLDVDAIALKNTQDNLSEVYPNTLTTTHKIDVRQEEAWAQVSKDVTAQHGGVHILINNAGVEDAAESDLEAELDPARFRLTMDMNFWSALHGTLAFVDIISKCARHGYVVNIASQCGLASKHSLSTPYVASKAALSAFTKALVEGEVLPPNIKMLDVQPGRFQSQAEETTRRVFQVDEKVPESVDKRARRVADASEGTVTADHVAHGIVKAVKKGKHQLVLRDLTATPSCFGRMRCCCCWSSRRRGAPYVEGDSKARGIKARMAQMWKRLLVCLPCIPSAKPDDSPDADVISPGKADSKPQSSLPRSRVPRPVVGGKPMGHK
ncbi:hypothetical protein CYMTET_50442 [Cymbomonas tetramitiformis]|uniref:Uncharacterized protein n=1 Tax=Cymbomonas tetramitiformis TaxID=36881 RepID=A0AAE0ETH1_9CHLO|nr:hypothetical protein CYMTET_50442 [Cymbomonas tetramitiformis]